MKLLFLSNYLTIHQKPLSDELYKRLGDGNFYFVSTEDISRERKDMGWPVLDAPYQIRFTEQTRSSIEAIIDRFDAVIFAHAPLHLVKKRYLEGKLTICNTERRYKTIFRYLKYPINTIKSYYINKGFFLSSSAFAPKDYIISGMSHNRCFRWGYFPEVRVYDDVNSLIDAKGSKTDGSSIISLLWAGRLIGWKHPEIALTIALRLKKDGYCFKLKIIGGGVLEDRLRSVIIHEGLSDYVELLGSLPPSTVRAHMDDSDIFLFTSDRHEGWGAVLNESMNSACAVVASSAIGSVPYLLNNGYNGLVYRCGSSNELYYKVRFLIDNPTERRKMQKAAYATIRDLWNPQKAAENLISLCDALNRGEKTSIANGPGSPAPLILDRWLV